MKNLEIKARYDNHADLLKSMRSLGARKVKVMRQIDTYFSFPDGRLKLREFDKGVAELIVYRRPEKSHVRWSDYSYIKINNPKEVKKVLSFLFGVKVIVTKTRVLYLYKNARIHVDTVKNLGRFMEIEVLVKNGERQAEVLMNTLLTHLNIPSKDFIKVSYSDLLAKIR